MTANLESAVGGLPPVSFAVIERLREYRRSAESEAHHRLAALIERTVGAVGMPLLRARDEDELDASIDAALEAGELARALHRLRVGTHEIGIDLAELAADSDDEAWLARLRADVAALVRTALRNDRLQAEALHRLATAYEAQGGDWQAAMSATADQVLAGDPLGFIAQAPVPVARAMLSGARGNAAAFGLLAAVSDPEAAAPGLQRWLAERWARGSYDGLRWLALFAPAEIPLDVVPEPDRLGDAARRALEAENERLKELFEAHDRGEGPLADPDFE